MPLWGRSPSREELESWQMHQHNKPSDDLRFQEFNLGGGDFAQGIMAMGQKHSVSDKALSENINYKGGAHQYDSPDEYDSYDEHGTRRRKSRSAEEQLAMRAQERIRKAKAKGKSTVNLSHEEIEALERRYPADAPDEAGKTPSESPDSRRGSRKGSPSSKLPWTRKKSSPKAPSAALVPVKRGSRSSPRKDDSQFQEEAYSSGAAYPPGMMIAGTNGAPVFSPLGYYNAQPTDNRSAYFDMARPAPGFYGNPAMPAPYPYEDARYHQSRHMNNTSDWRPPSSSSHASSANYSDHDPWAGSGAPYPTEAGGPVGYAPYPPHTSPVAGRRVMSGPADPGYQGVHRRPVAANASLRGKPPQSSSDPALGYRAGGRNPTYDRTSSEDDYLDEEQERLGPGHQSNPRNRRLRN